VKQHCFFEKGYTKKDLIQTLATYAVHYPDEFPNIKQAVQLSLDELNTSGLAEFECYDDTLESLLVAMNMTEKEAYDEARGYATRIRQEDAS
jgi:hypothetical protein